MSDDDKKFDMWTEVQKGYLRKIGEDAASGSSGSGASSCGSVPVLLGLVGLWVIGSTVVGFAAGQPGPLLLLNALFIVSIVNSFF